MIPYVTQHVAPIRQLLAGIVEDIPRYVRETTSSETCRSKPCGAGKTPVARAQQAKILAIIRSGERVTTKDIVKALDSNRFSAYNNASMLVEDGIIRLVKLGPKRFYWEVV